MAASWMYGVPIPARDSHKAQKLAAFIAGTTPKGTSIAGLKRALKFLRIGFSVEKEPWNHAAIVYDGAQDHWVFAVPDGELDFRVYDPLAAKSVVYDYEGFYEKYFLNQGYCLGLWERDQTKKS